MEYNKTEFTMDKIQILISFISSGVFIAFHVSMKFITDTNFSEFLKIYYLFFSLLFLGDVYSSLRILFISRDYDKHKWIRNNVGILAFIFFSHLILLLPLIYRGDISNYPEFKGRHGIILGLYILKIFPQIKIYELFQQSHRVLLGLD